MVVAEAEEEVGVVVVEAQVEGGWMAAAAWEEVQLEILQGWLAHRRAHL